ncbi:MAG: MFS transporter [Candidatus Heimdallarchaeota archaeon]|nr:MFS transporter [Candidatus Heimdallarchaeota archaeon]
MGVSISYFAVGFYFMYFLTDIVFLDPFLAGLAIFIGKFWDGMNDPIMGIISDRTKSHFGRKRVYILFGAIPFGISFLILWFIPPGINQYLQFTLATLALLIYATTYSICVVPYMSLVPIMSANYDERTQITGIRAILSTIGTIFGGLVALFISDFSNQTLGLRIMGSVFGAFTAISMIFAAVSVKGVEKIEIIQENEKETEYISESDTKGEEERNHNNEIKIADYSWKQYAVILKEKNVIILLLMKIVGAVGTGILTASLPYFAEHILGDEGVSTIGLAIYIASSALILPLWNFLTKKFDKRRIQLIGILGFSAALVPISFLISQGLVLFFYIGCAVLGLFMASYLLIPYSLVPDLVDFYEHRTGERHESIFFGLWMTVHQLGLALSGLILGSFLKGFNYNANLPSQSNLAILGIRLSFGVLPAVFLVIAIVILQFYSITRDLFEDITKDKVVETPENSHTG